MDFEDLLAACVGVGFGVVLVVMTIFGILHTPDPTPFM